MSPHLLRLTVAAVTFLSGCFSVKPAHYADLLAGKEIAGIPLTAGAGNSVAAGLNRLASQRIIGMRENPVWLALSGLTGDFGEVRVFYKERFLGEPDVAVGLFQKREKSIELDQRAAELGFKLGPLIALVPGLGAIASTSVPDLFAVLRPVTSDGPRELTGVLRVIRPGGPGKVTSEDAFVTDRSRPFPPMLTASKLEEGYASALAARALPAARTYLVLLRAMRAAEGAALDSRYEAVRLPLHRVGIESLKAGAKDPSLHGRLEAALAALEQVLWDCTPDGKSDPETEAFARASITDVSLLLGKQEGIDGLAPFLTLLQRFAATRAGELAPAVWASRTETNTTPSLGQIAAVVDKAVAQRERDGLALRELQQRLGATGPGSGALMALYVSAQAGSARDQASKDFAAEVRTRTLVALTAEAAHADGQGLLATAAALHLLRHVVSEEQPRQAPSLRLLTAAAAPGAQPEQAMGQARRALVGLITRYWPAFDPAQPETKVANQVTNLARFGRFTSLGALSCCDEDMVDLARHQQVPLVTLELGPWVFQSEPATTRVEQVSGTYRVGVDVSNQEAVTAWVRRSNELLARQSELMRQIKRDDEAAQAKTTTSTTYTGGGKVLAPQGSKYVYQDAPGSSSTKTTTTPGDSAAARRVIEAQRELDEVNAAYRALKRPPDRVRGSESREWTHSEAVQEWTVGASRRVALRSGAFSAEATQRVGVHEAYRKVEADTAHGVTGRNDWKTPAAFATIARAAAEAARPSAEVRELVTRLVEARVAADRARATPRSSPADQALDLAWADYLLGGDPSPALRPWIELLEPSGKAQEVVPGLTPPAKEPETSPGVLSIGQLYAHVLEGPPQFESTGLPRFEISVGRSQGVQVGDFVDVGEPPEPFGIRAHHTFRVDWVGEETSRVSGGRVPPRPGDPVLVRTAVTFRMP